MASLLGEQERDLLRSHLGEQVRFDEPMSRHTTLRIGGPADAWCAPGAIAELQEVIKLCRARDIPVTPVGGGSNLLVRDGGIRGVAMSTRNLRGLERIGPTSVRVQAGVSTGKLLSMATQWELGGLEFLGGVPGSVGGGLVMNAGTYLGEFVNVVRTVSSVRLATADQRVRANAECGFRYRGSDLPPDEVVVETELELAPRPREAIEADVRGLRDRRHDREPKKVSNAGSVFKNPPGDYAGRLIEAVGLKGRRIGGAECSPVHANWFVNVGGATARDMFELIAIARQAVVDAFGITLDLEWKVIGED